MKRIISLFFIAATIAVFAQQSTVVEQPIPMMSASATSANVVDVGPQPIGDSVFYRMTALLQAQELVFVHAEKRVQAFKEQEFQKAQQENAAKAREYYDLMTQTCAAYGISKVEECNIGEDKIPRRVKKDQPSKPAVKK